MFTPCTSTSPRLVFTSMIVPTVPLSLPAITCGKQQRQPAATVSKPAEQRHGAEQRQHGLPASCPHAQPNVRPAVCLHNATPLFSVPAQLRTLTVSPLRTCMDTRTGLPFALVSVCSHFLPGPCASGGGRRGGV